MLVGFLCGVGAALAAQGRAGLTTGLIASGMAILAVFAGKFASAHFQISDALSAFDQELSQFESQSADEDWMTVDDAVFELVNDETLRNERAGVRMDWPRGIGGYGDAYELEHYPADIVQKHERSFEGLTQAEISRRIDAIHRENMIAGIADEVAFERVEAGQTLAWPAGMTYDEAFMIEDYPADIVADATARWDSMTRQEQHDLTYVGVQAFRDALGSSGFTAAAMAGAYSAKDFFFDALWIVLAVGAAFAAGKGQD